MKKHFRAGLSVALLLATVIALGHAAEAAAATVTGSAGAVWVRFTDKGVTGDAREAALRKADARLTDQARERRERRGDGPALVDEDDLPLDVAYVEAVAATGMRLRRQSRWLNSASFEATQEQIDAVAKLPFVASIEPVRRGARDSFADLVPAIGLERGQDKAVAGFAYGPGKAQLEAVNIPAAHARGLSGAGVTIAILDTGFDLQHESVAGADVVATWNFLANTPDVGPASGEAGFQLLHGTAVFSLLAAKAPGIMYGSAPGASYILAKTENVSSETPAEEDNWIAALEWAEDLGADVVSSSAGYYTWYQFADCNGVSTAITAAAELAAARGVCIVNSVGNERQNPAWPHLIPPADGRHVIAVGGSSAEGLLTSFTSPGPTADGRHKPDVMGLGVGLLAALGGTGNLYGTGDGVDYGVPVVAGAVALMLERNPGLSPGQVLAALHATASRASAPDNDYGWGQANADAACEYGRPSISHLPLGDREAAGAGYEVVANISAAAGLAPGGSFVAWRRDAGAWQLLPLQVQAGTIWHAVIPAQSGSGALEYYLVAEDTTGRTAIAPLGGEQTPYSFRFGIDTQLPVLGHVQLADQVPAQWPPLLVAQASDNVGVASVNVEVTVNGVAAGTGAMEEAGGRWQLPFPIAAAGAPVGTTLGYRFTATDAAATPNSTQSAWYAFRVVANRGNLLLIDDRAYSAKSGVTTGRIGAPDAVAAADKGISDIASWLTGAGFAVQTMSAGAVQASSLIGRDLVVVTSGTNSVPLANAELRAGLLDYVRADGHVLVEGGEVGYACIGDGGAYPDVALEVLHADAYMGEESPTLWPSIAAADNPFLQRPNSLEGGLKVADTGNWYGAADVMRAGTDGFVMMHPPTGTQVGGVIAHDNDSCPEAGQTLYFAFDLGRLATTDARRLVENAATWLTFREPAGPSSIAGHVSLQGSTDYSAVTVRTRRGETGVIDGNGNYLVSGLWDGSHVVTVSAPGYGSMTHDVQLQVGQQGTLNFSLAPVVVVSGTTAPNVAIPDNAPTGITSVIHIGSGTSVQGVEVDADIAHFSVGQLAVQLVNPQGVTVTLHNRTGGTSDDIIGTWPTTLYVDGPGSLADFTGGDPRGDWTLQVSDNVFGATGRLRSWGLRLLVSNAPPSAVDGDVPPVTRLVGNTPNPFNPRTTVHFDLGAPGSAKLSVFDARGRLVRVLAEDSLPAGRHDVTWDGRDGAGSPVSSGVYFARLAAGGRNLTLKMMLVK